ncbi:hypothetical protein SEA_GIGIOUIOUI_39 [Mycobacterium phage GigiOuiOui]|uniref:Uncharacterized protein n=3 Tax=Cheoctovirus TaxID=1623281 RepID=G8J7P1_9CAUD|nr:hypothetical protein FGG38_gp39 [Mycobacterium phage DotProduct]YP_009959403.1 hypothetical protein I5H60_gp039 [Mycobacterium phage Mantra]YP_009961037.1 hypothetical protein I5H76_gp040 [Mycobacterium phage Phasih]UXE03014.1 hypothetical protein SEA_GIGIOUIOUI_39 [Mycobacterium phage GigiOuiOui]AER14085.1 hypothetical protein DOTPRODUCT_39 [Mycobacterium phage DotProduct]ATN91218.1 hypothetical protein SEA_PHASIH_40 [Mycobacterium phage Phasih]AXH69464.1 hypothetical protein SEA_MANTRA_3
MTAATDRYEAVMCGGCEVKSDDVVYGMCTACGSVEVALMQPTGSYPTGHGCEMCN